MLRTYKAIKPARKAVPLTQHQLAQQIGVSQPLVSQWESGKTAPTEEQSEALHELLPMLKAKVGVRPEGFGEWVFNRRKDVGYSTTELAQKAGLSILTIYNIEGGKTGNPQEATKKKLEGALGESIPTKTAKALAEEAGVEGLGELHDFDPHDPEQWPAEPGIYVFYDVSERPIYVGQGQSIKIRIRDHAQKFWFKKPIVEKALFIRIEADALRKQVEQLLIKFLKSHAVINKQGVDKG